MKFRLLTLTVLCLTAACQAGRSDDGTPTQNQTDDTAGAGGNSGGAGSSGSGGSAGSPGSAGSNQGGGGSTAGQAGTAGQSATPDAGSPRSPDAGVISPDARPPAGDALEETGTITIVAVGYAGRRVVSRDLGKTWFGDQTLGGGGDDEFLLRDAAFGAGRMVAHGWKFLSSTDGKTWTEHKNPHGQWQGGVAWGSGMFMSCGGLGQCARSADGVNWVRVSNAGNSHLRELTYKDGLFWTTGDSGTVYSTTNGTTWKTGGTYPGEPNAVDQIRVRLGGGGVEVSENGGATWRKALSGGQGLAGVAIGRLPP